MRPAAWGLAIGASAFALLGLLYAGGLLEGLDDAAQVILTDGTGSWRVSKEACTSQTCMIPFGSGPDGEGAAARGIIKDGKLHVFEAAPWSGYASRLGGDSAATTITVVTGLLLAALRQWRTLAVALTFAAAGGLAVDPLKDLFGRGYPSGHTIGATLQFGLLLMLGTAAWQRAGGPARPDLIRHATWAWAAVSVAVGLDRVLMGVHELSHVLAGWAFGVALVCGALMADRYWSARKAAALAAEARPGAH